MNKKKREVTNKMYNLIALTKQELLYNLIILSVLLGIKCEKRLKYWILDLMKVFHENGN